MLPKIGAPSASAQAELFPRFRPPGAEDAGALNMPWSARQTYHRTRTGPLGEAICAENNIAFDASVSEIPQAANPDF
jgi:hypothetical protein